MLIAMFGLLFTQCAGNESKGEEVSELTQEDEVSIEKELENIKMLNEELASGDPIHEQTTAAGLFKATSNFANNHPDHEKTPAVMELAAKASEIMNKPQQAINIMQKLVDEFPEAPDASKYMSNLARLYEKKGDLELAEHTYLQLIENFPNDPFAIDAQNYLNNILGKSETEILMFIDSVNNS